jgi:hypothetical protein
LLQAQRFVEDEAACACKAAHLPALLPGGHQLEAKSLLDEHAVILSSQSWNFKENRRLDGFADGAILPPPERGGLPRDSDQHHRLPARQQTPTHVGAYGTCSDHGEGHANQVPIEWCR